MQQNGILSYDAIAVHQPSSIFIQDTLICIANRIYTFNIPTLSSYDKNYISIHKLRIYIESSIDKETHIN